MILGNNGNVHDPGNHFPDSGPTKLFKMMQEKQIISKNGISESWNSNISFVWEKAHAEKILEIRLINSWESWIWDQYLSKTMKWISCIFFNPIEGIPPTHPPQPQFRGLRGGGKEKGKVPRSTGKKEKSGALFWDQIPLGNQTARTYALANETKRKDFPVGLTPKPPIGVYLRCGIFRVGSFAWERSLIHSITKSV